MLSMSDLQPDLGRRRGGGGGGGRRWGGGGGGGGWRRPVNNYYYGGGGGYYPYYDVPMLPTPVYTVDPIGPPDPDVEEAAKVRAIVAAVKAELAKDEAAKSQGMGEEDNPYNARCPICNGVATGATRCIPGSYFCAKGHEWTPKDIPAMGQGIELPPVQSFYIDVMGPGSRDADIDRIARDDELVDEAIPAREALAIRQSMGLSGMGDLSSAFSPENRVETLKTVGIVAAGAVGGYFVAGWLIKRLAA